MLAFRLDLEFRSLSFTLRLSSRRDKGPRCSLLFRFLRHLTPETPPMNRHWTCADRMDGDLLHLFDCSHEDEAVTLIPRESFVTRSADVQRERLLVIQPNSLRFLALPWRVHAF